MVVVEAGTHPVVVAGDTVVFYGGPDEAGSEGQRLDPELVRLLLEHQPWRPQANRRT